MLYPHTWQTCDICWVQSPRKIVVFKTKYSGLFLSFLYCSLLTLKIHNVIENILKKCCERFCGTPLVNFEIIPTKICATFLYHPLFKHVFICWIWIEILIWLNLPAAHLFFQTLPCTNQPWMAWPPARSPFCNHHCVCTQEVLRCYLKRSSMMLEVSGLKAILVCIKPITYIKGGRKILSQAKS